MQGQDFDLIATVVLAVIRDLMVDDRAAPVKLLAATGDFADEMLLRVMETANVKPHLLTRYQRLGAKRTHQIPVCGHGVEGEAVDEFLSRA